VAGAPQPFGQDRTQLLPPVQGGQQQSPSAGYEQHQQPQQPQQFGQTPGVAGTGSHQPQPPIPPTMQDYAAAPNPWSPGGIGSSGQSGAQNPVHGQGQGQGQQIPPARAEESEQRPGPFQVGDWRSE
jgi:hypothetical protein